VACVAAAVYALAVLLLMIANRGALDDSRGAWSHEALSAALSDPIDEHALAFLKLPSVWLCMSFFFWMTCALAAVQGFSSPALQMLYGLPLTTTSIVVTGFMLTAAVGMIAGGFFVDRVPRLEATISIAIAFSAVALVLAGSGVLGGAGAAAVVVLAGLGTGVAAPSRDMLIRRAAPPRATGRVYGTVYSGLDLGFAVSAPLFGAMLDRAQAGAVFYGAALALVAGVLSALVVGGIVSGRRNSAGVPATVTR
jgi:predicted MFS family arabinose efflux permease